MPWIEPFARWFAETDPRAAARLDLDRLSTLACEREIVLESGLPLRFVDAALRGDANYERFVFETGCVPTRSSGPGMVHDWFNALCWLRWPAIKARLNRLQADAIAGQGVGSRRGPLRDAITSFDESGALFVSRDDAAVAAWQRFDWQALFVAGRTGFRRDVRVLLVGHALLEKLLDPYKGICAQALTVMATQRHADTRPDPLDSLDSLDIRDAPVAPAAPAAPVAPVAPVAPDAPDAPVACTRPGSRDASDSSPHDPLDALDRRVAASIDVGFGRHRLVPLPLLGVPGWWPANEDPKFYNDADVFRQRRQWRLRE